MMVGSGKKLNALPSFEDAISIIFYQWSYTLKKKHYNMQLFLIFTTNYKKK